jgi:hypothetical protein
LLEEVGEQGRGTGGAVGGDRSVADVAADIAGDRDVQLGVAEADR